MRDEGTEKTQPCFKSSGLGAGWPIFALHHSHGGCPILAFLQELSLSLSKGWAAMLPAQLLSVFTPPVVYAVVVPALFAYARDGAPASVVASAV
jgi:hypothetical protein